MDLESSGCLNATIEQVLTELSSCVRQVSSANLIYAGNLIEEAARIFVSGAGRSGLCMRSLGVRLMHLGKTVYVVGETTTPSITAGDLLIIGSGSGQTASVLLMAERAKHQNANILLFTTDAASPLADFADHRVIIPAPSLNMSEQIDTLNSVQPMGTLFEQSLLILCDSLVLALMQRIGVSDAQMRKRHANLE
jgi:6-phospho-3-hexuloisomerase